MMAGQLMDKKAEAFWVKARNTVEHYTQFVNEKPISKKLVPSFTDLLYASNFKAGNGNVQEPVESIEEKLTEYSQLLTDFNNKIFDNPLNNKALASLDDEKLAFLLMLIERMVNVCSKQKIDGFGISYCSALFHFYFPNLIPVLDRRVLMGMKIVTKPEQMDRYGQVKKIGDYYEFLIRELHKQLQEERFDTLEDADKYYFGMQTPEHLKAKNLRKS